MNILIKELNKYHGTEHYYKIPFSKCLYTDGINALIDNCKCWWLISDLGIEVTARKELQVPFLVVTIKVNDDKTALITMKEDTNLKPIYKKKLTYTDFPLKEYEFYLIDNIFLLKGEY